jgi:hypothetical protein
MLGSNIELEIKKALEDPVTRWQWQTYEMIFKPIIYSRFECRLSKVAGCLDRYGRCKERKVIAYHICRTSDITFAVKFYLKDEVPVVGLSHHIMVGDTHYYYPAIDWDRSDPPPRRLLGKGKGRRPVFVWHYRRQRDRYHIVLPAKRRLRHAIYEMMRYTDPMHWAVTTRRIMVQGIYEDFAILRVSRLDDELLWYYADESDPMAWLNVKLRRLFWRI